MSDVDDQERAEREQVSEEELADADATISEEELADADAAISEEELADADAAISEEELADADATLSEEELADADAAISEKELADADATIAHGDGAVAEDEHSEPNSADPLPGEPVVATGGGGLLKGLGVLALVAGLVLGAGGLHREALKSRLPAALDQWEDALEGGGLPVPGVPAVSLKQPRAVADALTGAQPERAIGERLRALEAWSALLEGTAVGGDMPPKSGLGAAMWICAGLREPRPNVAMLRGLLPSVPGSFRETLSAACDLAAGQYRRAALKAKGLQGEAPVACAPALEYVRAEGNRLRIAEVLDQPAPSQISLRELLDDTASGSLPRELLREPLDARAGSLVGFLTRENPEIEQGELVLRLLVEAFPEGFPDGSHLEAAWPRLRAAFGALVGERLARWELDVAPALAIVAQASRIDPAADLAPRRQFAGWRATLNEVVDDPARLLRFTQRFLELGWLPPGMQDLVATHCVAHGQKALGDDTPGAILASALVHLGEIAAGSAEEAGARAEGLVSKHAVLESLLGPRKDPAARRIRARFSRLCGVALAGAGDWERAGTWFEKADAFGYEPRFRLLRDQARVEKGRGQSGRVLVLAKARVKSLEAHAAAARTVTGAAGAVGFELRGYPLQPALIDPLRCEAHLDLAEALLAGDKAAEAGTACARATELDPRNPRNLLLSARIFQSQGKLNEARKAVFKGLRAVREETIRKQFRALLQELGPN